MRISLKNYPGIEFVDVDAVLESLFVSEVSEAESSQVEVDLLEMPISSQEFQAENDDTCAGCGESIHTGQRCTRIDGRIAHSVCVIL